MSGGLEHIHEFPAEALANIFRLEEGMDPDLWSEQEFPDLYVHQLMAPIEAELGALQDTAPGPPDEVAASEEGSPKTFQDLFFGETPPLETLVRIKNYAKACTQAQALVIPQKIPIVLYLLAITAARIRYGKMISSLSLDQLIKGIDWALTQPWLDAQTEDFFKEARFQIQNNPS